MAIAIKNVSFKNGQDEKMKDSTNTPVVKIIGSVRRTPGDNPLLKVFLGKRDEYLKNKAFKVDVDAQGNFSKVLEFQDDPGKYFITVELLCDNNEFDTVTESVFFKDQKPTIDDFTITNADSVSKKSYLNDVFYFNSYEKNSVVVTFASNPVDSDLEYFYKLWLSCDVESDNAVPLSYGQNFSELNINLIENGDYFVYFKVIDSAGNFVTEKRKISIAKIKPDVTVAYLQIVSNDYFVTNDSNNSTKLFRLLVDIKAGIKINKAELRLYKNNKMITMKSDSAVFNLNILKQLQNSGSYFLDPIDISNWGLTYGSYEIEIYYKDVFNIEYYTNRTSIYVKDRQPNLYCNQLDLSNPATLVLDSYTELEFYFEDPFFKFKDKQVILKKLNENTLKFDSVVSTKNEEWQEVETGVYKTKLKIFFSENDINKKNDKFFYQMFEFSLDNDYSDVGSFTIPLVYKAEKNKVVLHEDFVTPKNNEFQSKTNGENIYLNDGSFLLPKESDSVFLKLKIVNEVDFGSVLNFYTCKNELTFAYGSKKEVISFSDPDDFNLSLDFSSFVVDKNVGASFSVFTNEVVYDNNEPSITTLNFSFFDSSNYKIENTNFVCYDKESFLEFIPKNIELQNQNLIAEYYNDYYKRLTFSNPYGFSNNELKKSIKSEVLVSDKNLIFSEYKEVFDVCFNRDLSGIFKNFNFGEVIKNNKFNFLFQVPYFNVYEDYLFFIDSQNNFNSKTVSSELDNFDYVNVIDNSIDSGVVSFDNNLVCTSEFNSGLVKTVVSFDNIKFYFLGEVSGFRYINLDLNYYTKDHQFFDFSNKTFTKENEFFVYSFKLNDGFEFYSDFDYKISFFNEHPVCELVFNNIETKNFLLDGSSYFTVFYKQKNHNKIFSFDVFYEVSLTKPSFDFSFLNDSIEIKKANSLKFWIDSILKTEKIKSLKIKNNENVLFTKDNINSSVLEIPVNIYDLNSFKMDNVLYFENEGIYNLEVEYCFVDEDSVNSIFLGSYSVKKNIVPFDFSFESIFKSNSIFKNSTFDFFVYESSFDFSFVARRIKKIIGGVVVDCFDNTYFSKQFKNIKKSSSFPFLEIFPDDFVDGVYNLDITIVDKLTNFSYKITKKLCVNSLVPYFDVANKEVVDNSLTFGLSLKNVFSEENFSKVTVILCDNDSEQKNYFYDSELFNIPLIYKKNKIKCLISSVNKDFIYDFPETFSRSSTEIIPYSYFSDFYCLSNNSKILNNEFIFYLDKTSESFFIFDFYCSSDSVFKWYKNDIEQDEAFVFKNIDSFSVPVTPDLKSFSFLVYNAAGTRNFGPFYFETIEKFSGFETNLTLINNDKELFNNSIFLETRIGFSLENQIVFNTFNVSLIYDSFSGLFFDKELSSRQISFISFSSYNFFKMFDVGVFKNKLHQLEVFKAIAQELFKWCKINNITVPNNYSKETFDYCFNSFSLSNNIEILKKVVSN